MSMDRICRVCDKPKPISEYYLRKEVRKNKTYCFPRTECKDCIREKARRISIEKNNVGFIPDSKICKKCNDNLPPEKFKRSIHGEDRLSDWCVECTDKDLKANTPNLTEKEIDPKKKKCSKCKNEKSISYFGKDKRLKDGLNSSCVQCEYEYEKKVKKSNPEKYKKQRAKDRLKRMLRPESVAERMLSNAKQRAKRKNVNVTINKEWILERILKGKCEITGIDFTFGGGKGKGRNKFNSFNPSLDRIDPNRGYYPENSRVVINIYNTFKHRWSDEDVLLLCKALVGSSYKYKPPIKESNMRFTTIREIAYSRFKRAERTARAKGLEFELTRDWVEKKFELGKCENTGLPFVMNIPYHPFQPSLDKIDPDKGYTFKNTRCVAYMYNFGKQQSSDKDIEYFAKELVKDL